MHIIGILCFQDDSVYEIPIVEQALNRLGFAVHLEQMGSNIESPSPGEYYYEKESVVLWMCRSYGDADRCRKAAEAFVGAGVEAILAMTETALNVALKVTEETRIPIVFTHITREPSAERIIERLRRSDKVTGVWDIWLELAEERLALISEIVPPITAVHGFYNPELPAVAAEARVLEKSGQRLGLKLVWHEARNPAEVKEQLADLDARQDHALFRLADPTVQPASTLMGAVAHEQSIPYIGLTASELEHSGALFALEARGTGVRAAQILCRILRGEGPSSISCLCPTEKVVSVNLQVAEDLGLILSPAVMAKAQIILPAQESKRLASQFLGLLALALIAINLIVTITIELNLPYMYALAAGMSVAFIVWMWIYLNRRVITPIRELAITAEKIGAGELNAAIPDRKASMEINILTRALRRMRSNLKTSYASLDELNRNLRAQVAELTEANRNLEITRQKLELAGRRLVEAEDSGRFALTTYIHDEVYRPLDELGEIAEELKDPDLDRLSTELEQRIRQIRFELSVPILHDIGIELRRLIQEVLPAIYPAAKDIDTTLDLACLDRNLPLESAHIFLIYRFIRGAVSNAYRHSGATRVAVSAAIEQSHLILRVTDNGQGFDVGKIDAMIDSGHYFFYDIETRARQLIGSFMVDSSPTQGTRLTVAVPLPGHTRKLRKSTMAPRNHTRDKRPRESVPL